MRCASRMSTRLACPTLAFRFFMICSTAVKMYGVNVFIPHGWIDRITLVLSIIWNAFVFAITPLIVRYSAISDKTKSLVIILVLINNIFNGLAYPFAGSLGNGLRAAGDVKFTMIVSITLTIAARLFFSALFGMWLGWGVIGVALGMSIDLVFRGAIFIWRYKSQAWTKFQVI